ncbi:benzoate 1,2-dioxygenase small subunit [Methylobacterium sp. E-066]|uniref:benzoate 1,2-dioxygenase small subunit n=1 Tax=Methylobacterium sp. E-066 TaxID=2836584 RepID=UPI001FB8BDBA|nr:benzoate 1,2-dioxygenase small subunit [Methylobacterium sp. E-066]MCJ2141580.1 benzoate 1,2-dioxygenase small subunit [Methylobacterium sp. E-066]
MSLSYQQIAEFLYRESRLLDDRRWDEWRDCYAPDASYWMPAWDDDDTLVEDPRKHISLIYYSDRGGLEDRVFRIKTERSGATMPEPRTSHNITNIEVLGEADGAIDVRFNWHTLCFRYKNTDSFFGTSFYRIDPNGERPVIKSKKVVLKGDYIHQVIDVYHV